MLQKREIENDKLPYTCTTVIPFAQRPLLFSMMNFTENNVGTLNSISKSCVVL